LWRLRVAQHHGRLAAIDQRGPDLGAARRPQDVERVAGAVVDLADVVETIGRAADVDALRRHCRAFALADDRLHPIRRILGLHEPREVPPIGLQRQHVEDVSFRLGRLGRASETEADDDGKRDESHGELSRTQ